MLLRDVNRRFGAPAGRCMQPRLQPWCPSAFPARPLPPPLSITPRQVHYRPSQQPGVPRMLGPVRFRQQLSPVSGAQPMAGWARMGGHSPPSCWVRFNADALAARPVHASLGLKHSVRLDAVALAARPVHASLGLTHYVSRSLCRLADGSLDGRAHPCLFHIQALPLQRDGDF